MSVRKKAYGFLLLMVIVGGAGYGLWAYFGSQTAAQAASDEIPSGEEGEAESIPVETVVARLGSISQQIVSTANLRAKRDVAVTAQSEGVAREVLAEEGDFVKAGDLLCRLDATQNEIQLQSARQKLAQARLQLEKARILEDKSQVQVRNTSEEFNRYQKLFEEQLVSEREVAEIKYRLDELKHDLLVSSSESRELVHRVEELEAEIKESELEISRAEIRAPFSGYVTQRLVDVGQMVKNLDTLFQLGDFQPLLAEVFLSEQEAGRIRTGRRVSIISGIDDSVRIEGRVARISPVVDESTGTVKVTAELEQHRGVLKPGAFVRVAIETDTRRGAVLIPKRAVIEEEEQRFVFLVRDNEARKVSVRTGYESEGEVEILEGVQAGESVVVAGQGSLKEGSRVQSVHNSENKTNA